MMGDRILTRGWSHSFADLAGAQAFERPGLKPDDIGT
jgi:hypothetical protein